MPASLENCHEIRTLNVLSLILWEADSETEVSGQNVNYGMPFGSMPAEGK